jgi:heat shock protein HslJ
VPKTLARLIAGLALAVSFHAMAAHAADAALVDTYWKLVSIRGVAAETGRREAHLVFKLSGGLTGNTGCNNLGAVYTLDGDELSFSPFMTTRMYCHDTARTERAFLSNLPDVGRFAIDGNQLELMTASGVTIAIFEATDG